MILIITCAKLDTLVTAVVVLTCNFTSIPYYVSDAESYGTSFHSTLSQLVFHHIAQHTLYGILIRDHVSLSRESQK